MISSKLIAIFVVVVITSPFVLLILTHKLRVIKEDTLDSILIYGYAPPAIAFCAWALYSAVKALVDIYRED